MRWLAACFGLGESSPSSTNSVLPPLAERARPSCVRASEDWQLALRHHFELLELLGKGGYSSVYRARRLADGRNYALKVTDLARLTDWSREAAVREAHVLAGVAGHPCIATFREAFCVGSRLCIVSEIAAGGDLKQHIEQRTAGGGGLAEDEVWSVLLQVAVALHHLHHACRLLHRDLKPGNVLLRPDGTAQLTDFGICGQLSSVFTRKAAGSPQYKAPEMWRGQPYSFSSDMWALGCLLHEMCTGEPMFNAPPGVTSMDAATDAVRQQVLGMAQPPRLPGRQWSAELQEVAAALLQPDPVARLTAAELLALPHVEARLAALPRPVRAHALHRAHAQRRLQLWSAADVLGGAPQALLAQPAELNRRLPRAAYPDGSRGVAETLGAAKVPGGCACAQPARKPSGGDSPKSPLSRSSSGWSVGESARAASSWSDSLEWAGSASVASLDLATPGSLALARGGSIAGGDHTPRRPQPAVSTLLQCTL